MPHLTHKCHCGKTIHWPKDVKIGTDLVTLIMISIIATSLVIGISYWRKTMLRRKHAIPKNSFTRFVFLICCSVLLSCESTQKDTLKFGLNGDVHYTFSVLYEAQFFSGEWTKGDQTEYGHVKMTFSHEGQIEMREQFRFRKGRRNDMRLLFKSKYIHNNENPLLEIQTFNESGELERREVLKKPSKLIDRFEIYDSNDSLVSEVMHHLNGSGIPTEIIVSENKDTTYVVNIEYDNKNQLLTEITKSIKYDYQDTRRYEYIEFDSKGNWVSALIYNSKEASVPGGFIERKVVYY